MAICDSRSLPISISIESASPHETKLVRTTIRERYTRNKPLRVVGDKAYDSDPLDAELAKRDRIELIAPHKSNRVSKATQDGRPLRRYRNRWKVERFFSWIKNYRRIEIRRELYSENYFGMVILGASLIIIRHL